jgi:hypothetical protein
MKPSELPIVGEISNTNKDFMESILTYRGKIFYASGFHKKN